MTRIFTHSMMNIFLTFKQTYEAQLSFVFGLCYLKRTKNVILTQQLKKNNAYTNYSLKSFVTCCNNHVTLSV